MGIELCKCILATPISCTCQRLAQDVRPEIRGFVKVSRSALLPPGFSQLHLSHFIFIQTPSRSSSSNI